MADIISRIKLESGEFDSKIKRAASAIRHMADECHNAGSILNKLEDENREYIQSIGKMETVNKTARGSVAELTSAFMDMKHVYNQLSQEEKNGEIGKELNKQLEILKQRINDGNQELRDMQKELNGGGGLSGALDAVAGKFGLSIDQVTKFGGVLGVATTAVQVAKDAFFQSEGNIDEWGRTVEGAKGAYNIFLDTLNNGNWSNFFQNLQTAIQGGRDLYDIFDRLGSIKSNNAAAIAMVQQQIAQLRLAKQQGENVDAQLKEATARLAQLQKQSITAGKAAGNKSAFEVIRNGVNSVGGARYNDATINYVIGNIMKNGQSEFDKYRNNYQTLRNRGMVTKTQTIYDSQGGTYERQYKEFDINALTKEQQKQYSLAKAITEGETRIQKGIAAYAQAVQEGTASAREEFKGNRYALQGSSGGGGGGKGGGKTKTPTATDFSTFIGKSIIGDDNLKESDAKNFLSPYQEMLPEIKKQILDIKDADLGGSLAKIGEKKVTDEIAQRVKLLDQQNKAMNMAAQAANNFGAALAGLDDPSARAAGTVIQAIANIALGFGQAVASAGSMGPWGWLAYVAAGTAALATTISTVHSLTGYAQGGMVEGNKYSGDQIPIMANAGEVVLTKAMQGNLASQLQGEGQRKIQVYGKLAGNDIILSADRTLRLQGKELMVWGRV